jgi:hypothetical protein
MRLAAYLLWIPGLLAVIAAVILPVVSSGLSRRSRVAASWPQIGCGQVRAGGIRAVGDEPVHVHGASAPGPAGLLRGRQWGAVVELHNEKPRLRDLAAAVHACAPGLPVWDAGQIGSESISGPGRR